MTTLSPEQSSVKPDLCAIAGRIGNGDGAAQTELIANLASGIRLLAERRLGDSAAVEEVVAETFALTIGGIRSGKFTDHDRVLGYVRANFKQVLARHLQTHAEVGRRAHRDEGAEDKERRQSIANALQRLNSDQREILQRYYAGKQTGKQICQEMKLSETAFRKLKQRAAANLELLAPKPPAKAGADRRLRLDRSA